MGGRIARQIASYWDPLIALLIAGLAVVLDLTGVGDDPWTRVAGLSILVLIALSLAHDRLTRTRDGQRLTLIHDQVTRISSTLDSDREMSFLAPSELSMALQRSMATTGLWRFKGGTGTYLRAETLPRLCQERQTSIDVRIEIIPPDDTVFCRDYAIYRGQTQQSHTWTEANVRIGAYAVILAAVWYTQHTPIQAQVGLSRSRSTIRYDLATDHVFMTHQSPSGRALVGRAGGHFYGSIVDELDATWAQARVLDLDEARSLLPRHFTGDHVRASLAAVKGLSVDDEFLSSDVCESVADQAISARFARELGFGSGGAQHPYPPSS